MKNKVKTNLITLASSAGAWLLGFILIMVGLFTDNAKTGTALITIGSIITSISFFTSLITGIVTVLRASKGINEEDRQAVVPGILGILGGVFGSNLIVSLLKLRHFSKNNLTNGPSASQNFKEELEVKTNAKDAKAKTEKKS